MGVGTVLVTKPEESIVELDAFEAVAGLPNVEEVMVSEAAEEATSVLESEDGV